MDSAQEARGTGGDRGQVRTLLALLVAGLLAVVAVLFLGLVMAFGPDGFGGDGTPTPAERLRASIGEWTGTGALALALATLVAFLALRRPVRDRVVMAVVACEAVAVLVLVGSTWG